MPARAIELPEHPVRGIVMMCAAVFCFVVMNTLVKALAPDYSVAQIIWARYFFHFLLILLLFPRRIPTLLVTRRRGLQVLRSVLVLLATLCMYTALRYLPLADVVAITFIAPLLVTGMSTLVLGERVGPRRWAAVGVGFVGVLVIIRPGLGVAHWATVLPVLMATFYATYQIVTRLIRGAATPLNSLFYLALVGVVVTSIIAPFDWIWPDWRAWLMLIGTGFFGGLGHFAIIRAYESAPAATVAPFAYTELLWALAIGAAIFADFPDRWTLAGAAIVAFSGLYVLHREQVKGRG